jgi:hypothetical protein
MIEGNANEMRLKMQSDGTIDSIRGFGPSDNGKRKSLMTRMQKQKRESERS